jgi:hypothetical protein
VGRESSSIATVTDTLQELLTQAKAENLIPNAAASIAQIDSTAQSFEDLTVQLQAELSKVDPVLRNLQAATAHANNIVAALDNPKHCRVCDKRRRMRQSSPPNWMPWEVTSRFLRPIQLLWRVCAM